MRSCLELEYLDIQYVEECEQSEGWIEEALVDEVQNPITIKLPRLERINIHFWGMEAAATFRCLSLPALKHLSLAWYDLGSCPLECRQNTYDAICELVKRSKLKQSEVRLALNCSGRCYSDTFAQRKEILPVLLGDNGYGYEDYA